MKENISATILFADLMNSTEMAKNLSLNEYDDMIVDFQTCMYEVTEHHLRHYDYTGNGKDSDWSIVGDELRVFLYSGASRFDVRNALLIASKIKLAWLASSFNEKILKEGRLISRVGVGINCGRVIKGVRQWRVKMGQESPHIEGYAINMAKRIESASREGAAYQIMVGDSVYRKCQESKTINAAFSRPRNLVFKGIGQKIPVYEVVSFVDHEILETIPGYLQNGLIQKMEYAVSRPMPEPWVFINLLRHYISLISSKGEGSLEFRALELAQQALDCVEFKATIYNMLGWLYLHGKRIRNFEMAINCFNQSLAVDPGNEAALLNKAKILETAGQPEEARHIYEEILFHNQDHAAALKKLVYRSN